MPYIVIDSDRAIVLGGILPTQAAANTLAATESDWTAHPSEVTGTNFNAKHGAGLVPHYCGCDRGGNSSHGAARVEERDEPSPPLYG